MFVFVETVRYFDPTTHISEAVLCEILGAKFFYEILWFRVDMELYSTEKEDIKGFEYT